MTNNQIDIASLELLLSTLPDDKAKYQGIIIDALMEKSKLELRIEEIKIGVSERIAADKLYTNELARKSAIMYALSQNIEYLQIQDQLQILNLKIDLNRLQYQKAYDLLQACAIIRRCFDDR